MAIEIYSIPNKMVGSYYPEYNLIIDEWFSLDVTFEEWKLTIYDIGIKEFIKKNKVTAWITDTGAGKGVFKPDIQVFREQVSSEEMARNGIECYFTVLPKSAISKLSVRKTSKAYSGNSSMKAFAVESITEAMAIIKKEYSYTEPVDIYTRVGLN